jgi:hypothetical protein
MPACSDSQGSYSTGAGASGNPFGRLDRSMRRATEQSPIGEYSVVATVPSLRLRQTRRVAVMLALCSTLAPVLTSCTWVTGPPKEHGYSACGQGLPGIVGVTVEVWTVEQGQVITDDGYEGTSIGSNGILVLVSGCSHGAVVKITGRSQVKVSDVVHTSDGLDKAIELVFPTGEADPRFPGTLSVTQKGKTIAELTLGPETYVPPTTIPGL